MPCMMLGKGQNVKDFEVWSQLERFADNVFKCNFLEESLCTLIQISLIFAWVQMTISHHWFGYIGGFTQKRGQFVTWSNDDPVDWCIYASHQFIKNSLPTALPVVAYTIHTVSIPIVGVGVLQEPGGCQFYMHQPPVWSKLNWQLVRNLCIISWFLLKCFQMMWLTYLLLCAQSQMIWCLWKYDLPGNQVVLV